MNRRSFLAVSTPPIILGVAGCLEDDAEVDETFTEFDDPIWNFDLEDGDVIEIELENERGYVAFFTIIGPTDETVYDGEVETEDTFQYEIDEDGVHRVFASASDRASITIWIHENGESG